MRPTPNGLPIKMNEWKTTPFLMNYRNYILRYIYKQHINPSMK